MTILYLTLMPFTGGERNLSTFPNVAILVFIISDKSPSSLSSRSFKKELRFSVLGVTHSQFHFSAFISENTFTSPTHFPAHSTKTNAPTMPVPSRHWPGPSTAAAITPTISMGECSKGEFSTGEPSSPATPVSPPSTHTKDPEVKKHTSPSFPTASAPALGLTICQKTNRRSLAWKSPGSGAAAAPNSRRRA